MHGGGTIIYVSEQLTFKHQTLLQHQLFEHLWVDIRVRGKLYAVNALYRPSTQTSNDEYDTFLTAANDILSKLQNHNADNRIFASDMNFGNSYCKLPILEPKPLDSSAPELFEGYGYRQLIDIPTRITNDTTSLIDLIYLDNIDAVTSHGSFPKIADHDGIFVSFHCTQENIPVRTRVNYDYTNVDEEGLVNHIKNIDFDTHVFSKPYIHQAEYSFQCFHKICSQ